MTNPYDRNPPYIRNPGFRLDFKIEGLERINEFLQDTKTRFNIGCQAFMVKMVQHATNRAAANAPIKTGDLRNTLVGAVQVGGGEYQQVAHDGKTDSFNLVELREYGNIDIQAFITDAQEYAVRMHESFYNLGPRSAAQPPTIEGGVGRKYITRVIDFHLKSYIAAFYEVARVTTGQTPNLRVDFQKGS
jgi:hypothetical protein